MCSGIYTILNKIDRKIYVGKSINIEKRLISHKNHLRINKHHNTHLQNAVNKYGIENFEFEVLEECEERFLVSEENYWINMLNTCNRKYGYNLLGGNPLNGNGRMSPESIEKTRVKKIGKKASEETKRKMSESRKGKTVSEETRQKIIKSNIGRKLTKEMKDKIGKIHQGKKLTSIHKKIISDFFSKPVIFIDLNGNKMEFSSIQKASDYTKISLKTIRKAMRGEKIKCGYIFLKGNR